MIQKEVKEIIFREFNGVMSQNGYRLRKSAQEYHRKLEDGRQYIVVAVYHYHPVYEFNIAACCIGSA